jgi:hypothetical protein
VAIAVTLSACAGMSRKECELADWRAVGYEDGYKGMGPDRFGVHRRECADHSVAPDFAAWQAGRAQGLAEYCQPARGFDEGARGATYFGVCPAELEDDFVMNYDRGRTLYLLESEVQSIVNDITRRQARMREIERSLASTSTRILASETTLDERAQLLVRTKQLTEERVILAREVRELEGLLEMRQQELAVQRAEILGGRV